MTVLWTAEEAIKATGGKGRGSWIASGVSIDTRTLEPGDLFVAIQGPNFDGHAFVADALKKGAAAALVSRIPEGLGGDDPLLLVDDTLRGLESLGRGARARAKARVVAVTGSVGKTGCKEALRHVLSRQGPTHATTGNLNNHWGLPLTLARMPRDTRYAVLEMGMNHPGEIIALSGLGRPHVALITTVEAVHKAHFPSTEAIADTKAEIFAGLESDGVAVLNRDNRHFERLHDAAEMAGAARIIGFGADENAQVRLIEAAIGADGSRVEAEVLGTRIDFRIGAPGRHWVQNMLGVLAAVSCLGADVEKAARDLANLNAPKGRGQRHEIMVNDGLATLIDESYNASPASMAAALDTLGRTDGARRIAVLGDMLELGDEAPELHAGLATLIEKAEVDKVFTAGKLMNHLWDALPRPLRGGHAADSKKLSSMVRAALGDGDVVMVKGSAGSRMGLIVDALLAERKTPRPQAVNGD